MEEVDNNNIFQDDGTNELIQDLFARLVNYQDEENDDNIFYETLLERKWHHFMKAQDKIFSLLHDCWWA